MAMTSVIEGHPLQPAVDKLILENKSTRDISKFLHENGVELSHVGVGKYVKSHKDFIKVEVTKQVKEIRAAAIEQQVTAQMFLTALVQKGYDKLLKGDYDDSSLRDIIAAARILVPTQIQADIATTVTMEDVITTLSEESDTDDSEQESDTSD